MKKVLLGLVIVLGMAWAIGSYSTQAERLSMQRKDKIYNEIMQQDFEYDYPTSATDVVKMYCEIEALVYSTKFEGKREGRLEELVSKQLELLDDELISFNGGKTKIILSTKEDSKKFLESGFKIMEVKYQTSPEVDVDENGNQIKFVKVIEYVSVGENAYKVYALRRDENKRWKIITYGKTEPFTIS